MPGAHGQQGRDAFAPRPDQGEVRPAAAWGNQADEGGRGCGGAAQRRNQGTLHQNFPGLVLALAVSTSLARSTFRFDVSLPVLLAFSATLCLLILLPLSWLVYYSVHDRAGGLTVA